MGNFTQYDAKDCSVIVNGVYITGLGETMIECSRDEQFFETAVGAQGDIVMNEINNDLGTISITVQATSPQKVMLLDLANAGTIVSIWITNKPLGERIGGTKARIKNYPELNHGKTIDDRKFEFAVMDYRAESV